MADLNPMTSQEPFDKLTDEIEKLEHQAGVDEEQELVYPPDDEKKNEEKKTEESTDSLMETAEDEQPLGPELQQGFRILKELMADSNKSVNWPFLDPVDSSLPETADYYEQIKTPIWLCFMKDKFVKRKYDEITEFVADFRLMLENCYRYNGPDHYISKRGQRLETMMEQKLALLSRELREKTNIAATSGQSSRKLSFLGLRRRGKAFAPHDSSALLNQLRAEEALRGKELRKQMIQERKATQEAYTNELLDWEDVLLAEPIKTQMRSMWELPQIGHFLFLCQVALNIGEVIQFELERCFAMPRESSTLQWVMTCLMSTPFQRTKLDKKSVMPYRVWEEKVRTQLKYWYKVLDESNKDSHKAATKLGLDPHFFIVVGQRNPLENRKYHELGYFRRVWIVKSICDHLLETQEYLRDAIEIQPIEEQRDYFLGIDGEGNSYLHFPQFCGADVRIYRQSPVPLIKFDRPLTSHLEPKKEFKVKCPPRKKKKKAKKSKPLPPPRPRRPSRLRQNIKTVLPQLELESESSCEDSDESQEISEGMENNDSEYISSSKKCQRLEPFQALENCDTYSESESSINEGSVTTRSRKRTRNGKLLRKVVSRNLSKAFLAQNKSKPEREDDIQHTDDKVQSDEDQIINNHSDSSETIAYSDNVSICSNWDENSTSIVTEVTDNVSSSQFTKNTDNVDSFLGVTDSEQGTPLESLISDLSNDKMDFNDNSVDSMFDDNRPFKFRTGLRNHSMFTKSLHMDDDENSTTVPNEDVDSVVSVESGDTIILNRASNNSTNIEKFQCVKNYNIHLPDVQNARTENSVTQDTHSIEKNHNCSDRKADPWSFEVHKSDKCVCDCSEQSKTFERNSLNHELTNDEIHINSQGRSGDLLCMCPESEIEGISSNHMSSKKDMKDSSFVGKHAMGLKTDKTEIHPNCEQNTYDNSKLFVGKETENHSASHQNNSDVSKVEVKIELSFSERGIKKENDYDMLDSEMIKSEQLENSTNVKDFSILESWERSSLKVTKGPKNKCISIKSETSQEIDATLDMNNVKEETTDIVENIIQINASDVDVKDEVRTEENELMDEGKNEKTVAKHEEGDIDQEQNVERKNLDEGINEEEEEEEEITPEIGKFELIVDSVEALRSLVETFSEPEVINPKNKLQKMAKSPRRKKCVADLHGRLEYLLKELEPWESKLVLAAKKARIKLRKEQRIYKEEEKLEDVDAWKTDNSNTDSSESDNSDSDSDQDSSEPEKGEEEKVKENVKMEENNAVEEIDVSSRGRLRRKRIIPNNVADQESAKKRKVVKKTEPENQAHDQNILQKQLKSPSEDSYFGNLLSSLGQLSSLQSSKGFVTSSNPILIQTSQGPAVVTGLTNQALANLRLSTGGNSQPKGNSPRLSSHPLLQPMTGTYKHSTHPVMQQLLTRGQYTLLASPNTTVGQHSLLQQLGLSNRAPAPKPVLSAAAQILPKVIKQQAGQQFIAGGQSQVVKTTVSEGAGTASHNTASTPLVPTPTGTGQKPKMQYYATNIQSLPQNVLQQLLRNQAVRIQTGPSQTSYVILGNTVNNSQATMNSTTSTVSAVPGVNAPTSISLATTTANSVPRTIMTPGSHAGGAYQLASSPVPSGEAQVILPSVANAQTLQYQLQRTPPLALQSASNPSQENFLSSVDANPLGQASQIVMSPSVPLSVDVTRTNKTTVGHDVLTVIPGNVKMSCSRTSPTVSSVAVLPSSNSSDATLSSVASTSSFDEQEAEVAMFSTQKKHLPASNTSQVTSINPTVIKSTTSLPILSVTSPGYVPATSPGKQVCKYANNVTVKTLLEARKSIDDSSGNNLPPSTMPSLGLPPSSCNVLSVAKFVSSGHLLSSSKPSVSIPSSCSVLPIPKFVTSSGHLLSDSKPSVTIENMLPVSLSPNKGTSSAFYTLTNAASTIPAIIKLPSKAALDSAVKSVVASVKTSLPTANKKVPSPVIMSAIHPRKNITKTIQSLKAPIAVIPKVITKFPASSEITCSSTSASSSTAVTSLGFSTSATTSLTDASSATLLTLQGQKSTVLKVVPQQFISPQGVLQGILTPQGIVIPQAALQKAALQKAVKIPQGLMPSVTVPTMAATRFQHVKPVSISSGSPVLGSIPRSEFVSTTVTQITSSQLPVQSGSTLNNMVFSSPPSFVQSVDTSMSYEQLLPSTQTHQLYTRPFLSTEQEQSCQVAPSTPSYNLTNSSNISAQATSGSKMAVQSAVAMSQNKFMNKSHTPTTTVSPLSMLPESLTQNVFASRLVCPVTKQAMIVPTSAVTQASELVKHYVAAQLQNSQLVQMRFVLPTSQSEQGIQEGLQAAGLASPVSSKQLIFAQQSVSKAASVQQGSSQPTTVQRSLTNQLFLSPSKQVAGNAGLASTVKKAGSIFVPSAQSLQLVPSVVTAAMQSSVSTIPSIQSNVNLHTKTETTDSITAPSMSATLKHNKTDESKSNHQSLEKMITDPLQMPSSSSNMVPLVTMLSQTKKTSKTSPRTNVQHMNQPVKTVAKESSQKAATSSNPGTQRLILYSIGGQLVTSQGVPVTVDNGIMKILPEAKVQIANQSLTLQAPQNAAAHSNPLQFHKTVTPQNYTTVPTNSGIYSTSSMQQSSGSVEKPQIRLQQRITTDAQIVSAEKHLKGGIASVIQTKGPVIHSQPMTPKSGSAELLAKIGKCYATGQGTESAVKKSPVLSHLISKFQPSTAHVLSDSVSSGSLQSAKTESVSKDDQLSARSSTKHGHVICAQQPLKQSIQLDHSITVNTSAKPEPFHNRQTATAVINSKTGSKLVQLITNQQPSIKFGQESGITRTGQLDLVQHPSRSEMTVSTLNQSQTFNTVLSAAVGHVPHAILQKSTTASSGVHKQPEANMYGQVSAGQQKVSNKTAAASQLASRQTDHSGTLQNILNQQLVGQPNVARLPNISGQVIQAGSLNNIIGQTPVRPVLNVVPNQQYLQLIQNPMLMNSNIVADQSMGVLKSPVTPASAGFVMLPQLSGQPQLMLATSSSMPLMPREATAKSLQTSDNSTTPEQTLDLNTRNSSVKNVVQQTAQVTQNINSLSDRQITGSQNEVKMQCQKLIPNQTVIQRVLSTTNITTPDNSNTVQNISSSNRQISETVDVSRETKNNITDKQEAAMNLLTLSTQFVNNFENPSGTK